MLGDLGNYKGRKGTIFALQTPTRTFYLEAESPEDKKAWLDAIRQRLETWSKHRDKEGNVKSKTQEIEAATIPKLISKITDPDFSEQSIKFLFFFRNIDNFYRSFYCQRFSLYFSFFHDYSRFIKLYDA